jgi:hypothetical protein
MPGNNGNGFDPLRNPLFTFTQQGHAAKDLLNADDFEDFMTTLALKSERKALALGNLLDKCERYHMARQKKKYITKAKLLCSVNGERAALFAQTLAGVMVEPFFRGKHSDGSSRDRKNGKE